LRILRDIEPDHVVRVAGSIGVGRLRAKRRGKEE
jgi:hypothetical protein